MIKKYIDSVNKRFSKYADENFFANMKTVRTCVIVLMAIIIWLGHLHRAIFLPLFFFSIQVEFTSITVLTAAVVISIVHAAFGENRLKAHTVSYLLIIFFFVFVIVFELLCKLEILSFAYYSWRDIIEGLFGLAVVVLIPII